MAFDDALRGLSVPAPATSRDKLMVAAYNSPTDERMVVRYREAMTQNTRVRLGENRYLGVDGVEYQSSGTDDTRIPWIVFFDDSGHSDTAREFRRICLIPTPIGLPGRIEHPRGEIIDVVVASVTITDDPNSNASQTIVRVEFRRQLTLPADKRDRPELAMESALRDFNSAAADEFAIVAALNRAADRVATAREVVSQVNIITETMSDIIGASSSVLADFNAIKTDILVNMGTLLDSPAVLANQLTRLVQFALDAPGDFLDKLRAYGDTYQRALGIDDDAIPTLGGDPSDSITLNRANMQGLMASTASAAMMAATVYASAEYTTRQSAYEAASASMVSVPKITAALEITQGSYDDEKLQTKFFGLLGTLQNLHILKRLTYAATQQLTNKLLTTKILTLPRDTSVLQICWTEYNDVSDATVQAFIDVNNLSIDEIAVVPAGRTIYV